VNAGAEANAAAPAETSALVRVPAMVLPPLPLQSDTDIHEERRTQLEEEFM
jgi:hypothetical protein